MDDRQGHGGGLAAHGRRTYRARAVLPIAALVALLLLPAVRAHAGPDTLRASGTPRRFEIKVAGGSATFRFSQVAGCRYRITAEAGTLPRPILQVGRADEEPLVRVDAGTTGKPAVHTYVAEKDILMEVRVSGFSAQVGKGRVFLQVLGPGDKPVKTHRRFLAVGGERAGVGELLVREPNRWQLVVEEGKAYEASSTRGSAGPVRMRVIDWHGKVIADSRDGAAAWVAYPPVRFRVPSKVKPPAPVDPAPPVGKKSGKKSGTTRRKKKRKPLVGLGAMWLEVSAQLDGGGTYGVKLRELGVDEEVTADEVPAPAPVEPGLIEGEPKTFRAGPGDLALVYFPKSLNSTQRIEMLRGKRWVHVGDSGLQGAARSQENAGITWFRPYYPGTYRFRTMGVPPRSAPETSLHDRAALGSAPIHMGTGVDPTVRARLTSSWSLVGLAVCMPGWDYIYVCVFAPDQGVAMRVTDANGKVLRTRPAAGRTISPGLGPSMRFKVSSPGVYRLEARNARGRVVRPLLRRAQN